MSTLSDNPPMTTSIDVLRHGEPEGGTRYRGSGVDDPLTDIGWQQMWDAVDGRSDWTQIVSSPMRRANAFAEELSQKLDLPVEVDDRFKEIGFGVWEGRTPEEIIAEDPDALDHFFADPVNNRPEGAESLEDFSDRVWMAYGDVVERFSGEHVLIVAHAGVARAIVANTLHMPLDDVYSRLKITYAGILQTLVEPGAPPKMLINSY